MAPRPVPRLLVSILTLATALTSITSAVAPSTARPGSGDSLFSCGSSGAQVAAPARSSEQHAGPTGGGSPSQVTTVVATATATATARRCSNRSAAPSPRRDRFESPLAPPHPVVRPFEAPSSPYGPGHRGVDLGGQVGAPVLAAAAGVVVFAGPLAGRGVVSVDHPNGLRTTYEPVAPSVTVGRRVAAGAVLGHLRAGHAGCPAACLHWGVRRGEEYLDPLTLVAAAHVRLKPWEGVS